MGKKAGIAVLNAIMFTSFEKHVTLKDRERDISMYVSLDFEDSKEDTFLLEGWLVLKYSSKTE
jgi:hypothetical protein